MESSIFNGYYFFGPWVGEFGYELSYWIGECRAIRNRYPEHKAVASSYFGRRALYDFVDEFFPHSPDSINTARDVSMISNDGVVSFHSGVQKYSDMPYCVHITPGSVYNGLPLGGVHGHVKIKESVLFQKPRPLVASQQALEKVISLSGNKPIVSILCRNLTVPAQHSWPEKYWLKLIHRLRAADFCVVLLLSGYPSKPCHVTNLGDPIINLWRLFGESENFVDMQIAFLNKSVCSIATVSGATHYGYLIETPFLFMLPENNDYTPLYDIWKSNYANNKLQYLYGDKTVENISVDACYKKIKEML